MKRLILAAAAAATIFASAVMADEVTFKNGDRLTGTVVQSAGGKLVLKTTVAGDVTIDLSEVQSVKSDEPIRIDLKDGSTISAESVSASTEPGAIQVDTKAEDQATVSQNVEVSQIAAMNVSQEPQWSGSVFVGGTMVRGNSKSTTLSARADATRKARDNQIKLSAGYLFGRDTAPDTGVTTTTTENWFASGQYNHDITARLYGYGNLRIERDRIADLDLRLIPGGGVGYRFIEGPEFNFSGEAGLAWVFESYKSGGSEDHIAARLAYHLDWAINDKVKLTHDLEYLPSLEDFGDFNVIASAGVRATLTDRMFAELRIEDRYDATPAAGVSKTDLRYILGVGWNF